MKLGRAPLATLGWLILLALSPIIGFLFVLAGGVVAAWYCIVSWQTERAIARARKAREQSLTEIDRYLAETKMGKYDQQILSDPATLRRLRARLAPGSKAVN